MALARIVKQPLVIRKEGICHECGSPVWSGWEKCAKCGHEIEHEHGQRCLVTLKMNLGGFKAWTTILLK